MDQTQKEEIGKRIAKLRHAHHMTQDMLSEKLGVSPKHISHVERGCTSLSLKTLTEVSQIFQCSLDYLVFGNYYDKALKRLPESVAAILHSENQEEISRLLRYLDIYSEMLEKNQ